MNQASAHSANDGNDLLQVQRICAALESSLFALNENVKDKIEEIDKKENFKKAHLEELKLQILELDAYLDSIKAHIDYLDTSDPEKLSAGDFEGQSEFTHVHKWHNRAPKLVCVLRSTFPILHHSFQQTEGVEWEGAKISEDSFLFEAAIKPVRKSFTASVTLYARRKDLKAKEITEAQGRAHSLLQQKKSKLQTTVSIQKLIVELQSKRWELRDEQQLCSNDYTIVRRLRASFEDCEPTKRPDVITRRLIEVGGISGVATVLGLASIRTQLDANWQKASDGAMGMQLMKLAIDDCKSAIKVLDTYENEAMKAQSWRENLSTWDAKLLNIWAAATDFGNSEEHIIPELPFSEEAYTFAKEVLDDVIKLEDSLKAQAQALQDKYPFHQLQTYDRDDEGQALQATIDACQKELEALEATQMLLTSPTLPIGTIAALEFYENKVEAWRSIYLSHRILRNL